MASSAAEPRFLDADGVARRLSVGKTTVLWLVDRGILPPPIRLTPKIVRWDVQAIDRAVAERGGVGAPSAPDRDTQALEGINALAAKRRARRQAER
jgi:predicted DNA-binding transcriptional regulator AlpA